MALSKKSRKKAMEILNEILGGELTSIEEYNPDRPHQQHTILGIDQKIDGGWESVFINISHMNFQQQKIWEDRKREIPNTHFTRHEGNNITQIGWY